MYNLGNIILAVSAIFIIESRASHELKLPKLLIVSYDGFRYDYFERNVTPYLKELKTKGMYSDHMINSFVTKTLPNHHTIATGLYVENHGVVDSKYYDPELNRTVKYSYELYHYSNETLPIWILNEKAGGGRHSGVEWPGCEYEYGGITPTFFRAWNRHIPFTNRIDNIIHWFNNPETPINLAMLYIEEPDYHGHKIGIEHDHFNHVLKKLDDTTRYLHEMLNKFGLKDVNVIHLSDHGMSSVLLEKSINLNEYIDSSDYITSHHSTVMSIHPRAGKENLVFTKLKEIAEKTKSFDVYLKADIPERYHYRNNSRIGPILIVNKLGHTFVDLHRRISEIERTFGVKIHKHFGFGTHGYDNLIPEMHPIFFGVGPAFLPECEIPPFFNVDLVPLFCDILGIPQPKVDGTLDVFKKCLKKYNVHRMT